MKKILLIDDEKILNESLCDLIEVLGYSVKGYLSIKEAMLHEKLSSVDIIICDVGLPKEDAFDFIRFVKQNHDIPLILLSAYNEEEMIKKGKEAGADHYLVKPPQVHIFRQLLETL